MPPTMEARALDLARLASCFGFRIERAASSTGDAAQVAKGRALTNPLAGQPNEVVGTFERSACHER
jgi:hypothetical protein